MKKQIISSMLSVAITAAVLPVIPQTAARAASIDIGEYVQMGTYYGEPILWRCVDIDENGPLMLSDKILCLKPFDAAGDNSSGSHGRGYDNGEYRKDYGSNYWADSNMRSWLNSAEGAGNVTWLCGNSPVEGNVGNGYNDYADEAGFKTNFTQSELGAVKPVAQDSLLDKDEYSDMSRYGSEYHIYDNDINAVVQNAQTTAYSETVTDDFFLLDVNQVNAVYDNGDVLGKDYYIGEPTEQCVNHSEYESVSLTTGNKWHYWLRSPLSYLNSNNVRYVYSGGDVHDSNACSGTVGVRPAFYLNLLSSNFVSGSGTAGDPYTVSGSGTAVTPTTPEQPSESGGIDFKSRMSFNIISDKYAYGASEITYNADDNSYSQDKIGLSVGLTCLDFGGRDAMDVSVEITLPEGLSFSPDGDERRKTASETLSDKFFESSKSISADVYVRNASIGTHTATAKISGDGIEESELSAELNIKPYVFEVEKYRADWLLNWDAGLSSMENTYFKENPGELFVEAGKKNGLESLSDFWRGMNDLVDTVEDVSKLGDIVFEDKDMYEAILWDIFESSLNFNAISKIDAQIQSNGKNAFDYVSGQMKTIYGLTVADKSMYNALPDDQKAEWTELVSDSFEEEYSKLDKSVDIGKAIDIFFDVATDLEDVINRVSAYCMMASLQDSMKQVMKQMYKQCPSSETAMKAALLNCVNIMNSSSADVAAEIILAIAGSTGKRLGQIGISALWSGIMTGVKNAHPAVAVMLAAYKTGTFVSNALFNTDVITESYHKMDAVVRTEEIASRAYYWLKNKYQDDETEENAAAYNSAIDVMFNVIDKDCDSTIAFIDSVGDSFVESLKAVFGDTTVAEQKDSVENIQDSTYIEYESILTGWVFQLEADNVKEYNNYKYIIDESEERINKRYHIACPVDVYVYDESGREVASVTDDGACVSDNSNIVATAYNGEKYIFLDDSSYSLEYRATGSGAMDITIDEYDETGDVTRQIGFDDLPLSTGDTYSSEDSNEYVVSLDGENIAPDYDTDIDPEAAVRTQIEMDDDISPENIPEESETETSFSSTVSSWAKQEVEEAYAEDIVPDILVGEDLTKQVDRAEFAAIAVNLYENLSEETVQVGENPFYDIDGNECASEIVKAYNLNITNGITATDFEPELLITREQAATMLTRAYKKSEWEAWTLATDAEYSLNSMGVKKFDDDAEIADWAKESVYFMVKWGIINGIDENNFAPKANATLGESYGYATREQAIVLALRSAKHL